MSLKYERRLLEHLKHERYAPSTIPELMADLGVGEDDREAFEASVANLVATGRLARENIGSGSTPGAGAGQKAAGNAGASGGRLQLPSMPNEVVGSFRKNPKGFGFVVTQIAYREGDIFISPEGVADALTGDTVRVSVRKYMRDGERAVAGEIINVEERRRAIFTGELVKRGDLWLVMPDGRELTQPVVVKDPTVKNARQGDKVTIEITSYPISNELAEGVVVKVLGEAGLPDVETQAVIEAYGLPGEFPKECIEQARAAAQQFEREVREADGAADPFPNRTDLRDTFIITIDPTDSKDFDDAISIEVTPDGWNLGVHIADVSHFIPPDSPLDKEARDRANSVYLPRLVIPMLPEVLSNGICSLSEGVIRYCKSAFMSYAHDGRILSETVGATVIKSAKRLTYLEAQALIDGDLREARKHAKTEPKYPEQLIKTLREMDKLAKAIRTRRRKAGMIHLELPQVELVFDDAGHVVDAVPEDNSFTHTLIEMFMVEANEVLARVFESMDVPLLRRIHPEPPPGDVTDLRNTAKVAGFNIPRNPTRQELQGLLDSTAGTAAARAVHFAVLRTLTRAEYSPALVGHFALASEAYAHFTSPIRRYADLTVHRALSAYLEQTDNARRRPRNERERKRLGRVLLDLGPTKGVIDQDELVEIGKHASRQEENAEAAEQNLRNFLVLQLLTSRMGESFPGVVTNVSNTGVFVQLEKYLVDGLIKTEDLPTGQSHSTRWYIDQRTGALVHQSGTRQFKIGDRIPVTIAAIDLALRKMTLIVTDPRHRELGKRSDKATFNAGPGGPSRPGQNRPDNNGGPKPPPRGKFKKTRGKGIPSSGPATPGGGPNANSTGDDFFHHNRMSGSKRRSKNSKQHEQSKPDFRKQGKKRKGR